MSTLIAALIVWGALCGLAGHLQQRIRYQDVTRLEALRKIERS